ncbi:kinesin KIF9 isoform X1 [Pelobates cultripes]|uniref:Kinesin-like protein n=1 Tax=Pelobates cultripes TaxID=61616 RepID=A0AAD1RWQ8_PELCU|nr:kinesin KIF9 isoform X1 [Pelobates cultripes]
MCYGQTGAGKTFTTTGPMEKYQQRGIIPRALQQVFKEIEERTDQSVIVRISYLEIYNEALFDLLATLPDVPTPDTQMSIVDAAQGVHVKGLSMHLAGNEEQALNLLFEGETNRIIGSHILNKHSSRSHCIFTIHLESHSRTLSDAKYTMSKINLVDLAGSERLGKTGSEGQVLREATYINKSLTFLEQAIIALTDRKRDHIPFRQSKLTHALKDSLGGNCSTVLVANVYGEAIQIDETLSTLRFASRMKCIPVESVVIEHYDPLRVVKNLQKEIEHLKRELAVHDTLANRSPITYEPFNENQITEINSQVRRYLNGTLDEIEMLNLRQIQEVFSQFRRILRLQEQEVETRLKQKYIFIDKTDSAAISAAQKTGLLDADGHLVGEVDGQSFGIGVAPFSPKTNTSLSGRKAKRRKSKDASSVSRREGIISPGISQDQELVSATKPAPLTASMKELEGRDGIAREQDTRAADNPYSEQPGKEEIGRPSTPPAKPAAFEEFKAEKGSELSKIFRENKSILSDRKKKLKEITQRINMIKQEIDVTSQELNVMKLEREKEGEYISDDGHVIIDEKEFMLIIRLKDLKKQYRADYEELQDLKAEVQYCQKLVDQCRQRLLTEFEAWYNESFIISEDMQNSMKEVGSIRPGLIPADKLLSLGEDEQEKYDKLQKELLMEVPGALPFYSAKNRSQQKHYYSRAVSRLPPVKKKPGLINSTMTNKSPFPQMAM